MPTLAEQLDALAQREQQTEKLANAIKEFVLQDRIFDMLRKALSNKFTANIPYQRFNNEGFIKLKPMETSQFSGYNAYLFTIEVEPKKLALEARIIFDEKKCKHSYNRIPNTLTQSRNRYRLAKTSYRCRK